MKKVFESYLAKAFELLSINFIMLHTVYVQNDIRMNGDGLKLEIKRKISEIESYFLFKKRF